MSVAAPQPALREVRLMAPDPEAPGFRERLAADIARINAAAEAGAVEAWLDAVAVDLEAMIQAEEAADRP